MEFASDKALKEYAESTGRQYVKVTLDHNGIGELGSLIIELYTDQCPKTCENFVNGVNGKLPGGFKYQGTPVHRIVKYAYIQGGDVVDGTGEYEATPSARQHATSMSINTMFAMFACCLSFAGKGDPGWTIPDESFALKHDDIGWVGMANTGHPHTAATQFYITLCPLPWLDGKRVVFGKVGPHPPGTATGSILGRAL